MKLELVFLNADRKFYWCYPQLAELCRKFIAFANDYKNSCIQNLYLTICLVFFNKDDGLFLTQRFVISENSFRRFCPFEKKALLLWDAHKKCQTPLYKEKEIDFTSMSCTSGA